jgi:hypothetical protein
MMCRLLSVQLLGELDVESKEIDQFCRRIDFGLPCILALAEHRRRHNLISVFAGNQIRSFEEDCSSVGKGKRFPFRLRSKGRIDCSGNI